MFRHIFALVLILPTGLLAADNTPPLKLLFLGDAGHHLPLARFQQLQPILRARGITLKYTNQLADLRLENLAQYDGLVIYANHVRFDSPAQEKALLDFVESGKGFIPLHCASYCFIDSKPYIELVGAQFRSHTTGVFRVKEGAIHPIRHGYEPFESWDETYLHHKHNDANRTVLEYRVEGELQEPWTWVRTQGKGRVFYTAWGHDQRTWSHPGFHNLVERGIRWVCGQDPALAGPYRDSPTMTKIKAAESDFAYVPAKVPFYPAGKQWGTVAEPIAKMPKPLPAEKSIKHYSVPEGFELRLFADDEHFLGGKPLAMTWDEQGRLWVSVTTDYPNELKRDGEGRDRILILEDTDGDGKADRTTVFADKLSIATSLLNAWGGLVVQQAPHTLFLKDTDGDGKADLRQVLLTGWGTRDTHAGPSNLRYGPDNWIYGMCGYSGFDGTIANERMKFGQGFHRFLLEPEPGDAHKLRISKLEFLRSTNNNSWGVGFTEEGHLLGSTANGCPVVHLAIPNRYYERVRGLTPSVLNNIALSNAYHPITDKVRQVDWHGGFTSAAGLTVYTARSYPPEYWNRAAFVSDPTGHLTASFLLQNVGASYVARYGWNLAAADDEWAAPIDAQVGPDGMVWILDWYNYIVQHNPTPEGFRTGPGNAYETPLRDKKNGRIYRVFYSKATGEPRVNLANASPSKLADTLVHTNMGWRMHAQRLLSEQAFTQQSFPARNWHDLWSADRTVQRDGANSRSFSLLNTAVINQDPALRRAAVTLLARWFPNDGFEQIGADRLKELFHDPDAGVRLGLLLAICDAPPKAGSSIATVIGQELAIFTENLFDPVLNEAATLAAIANTRAYLLASLSMPATPSRLRVVELVARNFAIHGNKQALAEILASLAAKPSAVHDAIIAGLAAGWPNDGRLSLSADTEKAVTQLLTRANPQSRGRLIKLAQTWGLNGLEDQLQEITAGLLKTIASTDISDDSRIEAAQQAIEFRPNDEAVSQAILAALNGQSSPTLSLGLLEALSRSRAVNVGPILVQLIKGLPQVARAPALRLVLSRPESTRAFLDAVEKGQLRFDMLALDQKSALVAHPEANIAERAKKMMSLGGGMPDANRQKVIEEWHVILKKTGDVAAGKKAFVTHCAKCHRHGSEGQVIGPDLTGFAVHPKEEILIHVLDPSRSVEGNYRSYSASLMDGRVITGLLAAESRTTIELLDAENKRHPLNRTDIEVLKESEKSLMPEGFEKQMSMQDMTDLLEFMTQKGKYIPVPLDKFATAVSTRGMFYDMQNKSERLVFNDWKPKSIGPVPFVLTDPQTASIKNVIMLNGPQGKLPPSMPKNVMLTCNTATVAIHMLSGISGWGYPASDRGSVSLIVRLHYVGGATEEHALRNGVHFADYIRKVDVPGSQHAFQFEGGQQLRYLMIKPKRKDVVHNIEFVKGPDTTAPVIMAVTIETP